MSLGLPSELNAAFDGARSAVLITIDGAGQPVATIAPVLHDPAEGCFDAEAPTGASDPHVALVLGGERMTALVQGSGRAVRAMGLRIRPERVYHWPGGDLEAEPELYDAHLEEVRSSHNEEPEQEHAEPESDAGATWDERLDAIAAMESATGTVAWVGPDGFPFAVQVPVSVDADGRRVWLGADPVGAPIEPGPAVLLLVDAGGELAVRGDLLEEDAVWALRPAAVVS